MYAYHVVTEKPMYIGQQIIFDDNHHNGVFQRVYDKINIVNDIYANPSKYNAETLEHHTSVALRELALEEVRQKKYPQYPSGQLTKEANIKSAELYWQNKQDPASQPSICEMLVNGKIEVIEIVKEINININ